MATTLEKLYLLKIPEVQEAFIQVMETVVDRASIDEMVKAIQDNDIERLYVACGYTSAVLNTFIDKIEEVYKEAGNTVVSSWPKRVRQPIFDMRNERVEADLKSYSSSFVTNITDEIKENLQLSLSEGMYRGVNPRTTALNIVGRINPVTKKREGGIIGLSTNQVKWSFSARKYLENLDERYFTLGLRDKRFDSVVRRAIDEQKPLTKDDITRFVSSYNNRALKYRGNAIARTETMQSINRSERQAIEQGISEGLFGRDQVTKWWSDTHDGRTRRSHLNLGAKYSRKNPIPFDEPFVTADGSSLMYPGDQSLGAEPKEVIHCRCKAQYNIDWLKGL